MSFKNFSSGNTGINRRGTGTGTRDYARASSYQTVDTQYEGECEHIQSMLRDFMQIIEKIKSSTQQLTSAPTIKKSDLTRIHATSQEANKLAKDINAALTAFRSFYRRGTGTKKTQEERHRKHKRLLQDSAQLQQQFEVELKKALRAEQEYKQHAPKSFAHADLGREDTGAQEREQLIQQQELDNEIHFMEALIDERDKGIENIQQQVVEVSGMFKDLHDIVMDSGANVESIADNVSTAHTQAIGGLEHVNKANEYQLSKRKTVMCSLLCCLIFVAALLIYFLCLQGNEQK